jgi:hypothetical protein
MTSGQRHRSLDPVALRADAPRDPTPCARRCSSTVKPIINAPFATAPTSIPAPRAVLPAGNGRQPIAKSPAIGPVAGASGRRPRLQNP